MPVNTEEANLFNPFAFAIANKQFSIFDRFKKSFFYEQLF
jgi:hypothetical protein